MCHLQIEGVLLLVMRYVNQLHTTGIIGGLRHYLGGQHTRLFESQKNTVLFLLLVVNVKDKIETILEQYLIHHNNSTYVIKFHGLLCQTFLQNLEKYRHFSLVFISCNNIKIKIKYGMSCRFTFLEAILMFKCDIMLVCEIH